MFRTGSSTKSRLNLPVRIQYAVLAGLCLFLASFYIFESSCRVLPDSWAKTTAYKAVIGGTESTKRVAVWRETRYLGGVAGVTSWENVYLHNGTFYVIQPASTLPDPGYIMCAAPTADDQRTPAGGDRWRVIKRIDASKIIGEEATVLDSTFFFNDEPSPNMSSFLGHYYHYVAETFLAAWRITSSMYGASEAPARIMFRVEPSIWHDAAGLVPWFHRAVFPGTLIEDADDWQARRISGQTYMFEKLIIIDRFASHRLGGSNITQWNTMTMDIAGLDVPADWMEPLRDALARYVGVVRKPNLVPVVTYLNRQKTGRRLRNHDAEVLEAELDNLASRGVITLNNKFFEDIPEKEQFSLILQTDILLGVHGNGLTHQMWMKPGSTVIEIMGEGGFAMIFPWLARLMGHKHLAVHYDHVFLEKDWIQADGNPLGQDGDFRTDHIRVSTPFISSLVSDLAKQFHTNI